jgi:hypothetical protein
MAARMSSAPGADNPRGRRLLRGCESAQQLEDEYLPILYTKLHLSQGKFDSVAFSSDFNGVGQTTISI